jgi:FAD/FMN-containing dehydrogenase
MASTEQTNTEVGHEGGHASGVFPPFDPSTFGSQLLWLAIIFGALYVLMSRIGLPRVEGILATPTSGARHLRYGLHGGPPLALHALMAAPLYCARRCGG